MEATKVVDKKNDKKTTSDNKDNKETKSSGAQYNVLPGAEMGKVVTRFPPEPSGYLHIGHVKAAMLNYHYAKMYNGKMILRFDDTNPAKEKDEYVENIKKDLATLEIFPDSVTHTSDHFEILMKYMTDLIKEGQCYCDNTPVDQMRKERMDGIASKCRESTPEENLKIWELMSQSSPSAETKLYCVRAKIDYKNNNKCLRDPVFYRFSEEVHHRLGNKYKIFPTYDFACPIVDSIEGVTHCLRTNEYSDRIPMYKWVQKAANIREVIIYEFSRLNLIHTVLSKRNLKWFVENNLVEGWMDPRFPTVQGILRRGIRVQTLKDFMLAQGPSKSTNLMEWDKIYALNKDIVDPTAKRLFAVSDEKNVKVFIENLNEVEEVIVDWHPKNKEMGQRKQFKNKELIIEFDDAKDIVEGMKLTLYKWGNSLVTKVVKEGEDIKEVYIKLTPEDTVFKNTKIVHWVPVGANQSVKVSLVEFGHLITVKKMEDDMKIEDVVNKESKFETQALAEICVQEVKVGDIIQLERRGYFYVDKLESEKSAMQLHFLPDGKSKNISNIETKINVKTLSKGDGKDDAAKKELKEKKKEAKDEKKAKKEANKEANKDKIAAPKENVAVENKENVEEKVEEKADK